MELSLRLETIATYVNKNSLVADIGTDHAYLAIWLVKNHICKKVLAMDVNKGPLEIAKANIKRNNLDSMIETRISNGLENLQHGEVDTVVIAGMGGLLICDILVKGKEKLKNIHKMILQPQSDIDKVRKKVHSLGFKINDEKMIIDENKYYTVLEIEKGNEIYNSEKDYMYGKKLIDKKDKILRKHLINQKDTYNKVMLKLKETDTENSQKRLEEIQEKNKMVKEVLNCL